MMYGQSVLHGQRLFIALTSPFARMQGGPNQGAWVGGLGYIPVVTVLMLQCWCTRERG